jgi:hypothetical protein
LPAISIAGFLKKAPRTVKPAGRFSSFSESASLRINSANFHSFRSIRPYAFIQQNVFHSSIAIATRMPVIASVIRTGRHNNAPGKRDGKQRGDNQLHDLTPESGT